MQRSQFGPQYYINLAWYDPTLFQATRPKEHQCHVRLRVERACGVNEEEAKRALDLDAPMNVGARRAEITAIIDGACAFLDRGGTIAELREMHRRGELRSATVLRVMRSRLHA